MKACSWGPSLNPCSSPDGTLTQPLWESKWPLTELKGVFGLAAFSASLILDVGIKIRKELLHFHFLNPELNPKLKFGVLSSSVIVPDPEPQAFSPDRHLAALTNEAL